MKYTSKIATVTCLSAAAMLSNVANADTVLGGYVGIQGWNMAAEGGFSQDESLATFVFEDNTNTSFYAALEHPIPLVPNIKLARTTLENTGATSLNAQFRFGDEVYLANTQLTSDFDLSATDYILYYEILDNDLLSIDLGISGKQVEGDISVTDENGRTSMENISVVIPMAYGRIQVGLPLTGLAVYVEGSGIAIGDDSFTDYQAALEYNLVETLAIDLTLQAGYRSTELDINDVDDIYANITFDGVFLGLEFDF